MKPSAAQSVEVPLARNEEVGASPARRRSVLSRGLPILVALAFWELMSRSLGERMHLFPPPSQCVLALLDWASNDLWRDALHTYLRIGAGLALGVSTGVVVGLVTGRSRPLETAIVPILQALRPLPAVALIGVGLVWVGISDIGRSATVAFGTFLPSWLGAHSGARRIPERLLWCARTLTDSRQKLFWQAILPASLPSVIVGVRQAIAIAVAMSYVAELSGASEGIGMKLATWQLAYRMDAALAALALLGASGATIDWLFTHFMYWRFPWLHLGEHPGSFNRLRSMK